METKQAAGMPRRGRSTVGERLGGYIYGTILVLAVVVAGTKSYPHAAGKIALVVAVTAAVFWLAHVYAHSLALAVGRDERLTLAELRLVARREASIIEAAVPPVAALSLAALGVISTRGAVWISYGLGLTVLAATGLMFARIERLGVLRTIAVVAANLCLGGALVGLKLLVTH